MKDMALAGKTVSLFASIPERLDARQGDTDSVGIVAMRGKRLAHEVCLQALDPLTSLANLEAICCSRPVNADTRAQAFKTAVVCRM
jgi:hypothetical protein